MVYFFLYLITKVILQPCCQYRNLCILAKSIVSSSTPNHFDIRIKLVEEVVYLLQLFHEYRMLITCIYIEQYTFCLTYVISI